MEKNNFEIYYGEGVKQGVSLEEATQKLAKLLKIPVEKAQKMIEATHRVIKSGLTKDQSVKYYTALKKVGLQVTVRETTEQVASADRQPEKVARTSQAAVAVERTNDSGHPSETQKAIRLQFNGKGFEYFKIWIVNIFLTIVTLGVYSAWAKVRNNQYFYGNTVIDGSSFNYTAKPVTILKGRLIAVGLFIVYAVINQFAPLVGFILFLVLMGFLPWIIIRSLAFNARNSVFRNIRFNFTASVGDAVKAFLLWPLLMVPTLGLILPFVWYKQSGFMLNNSAYGTTPFMFNAKVRDYYKIFLIFLGAIALLGIIMSVLAVAIGFDPGNPANEAKMMALIGPFSLIIYLFMFGYLAASLGNLYFNSTTLAEHSFTSNLKTKNIAWIYFSNILAILLSAGLLIPWAKVRMARYRVHCLLLNVQNSLDNFIAAEEKNISALGEQVGEVFDMGVSVI